MPACCLSYSETKAEGNLEPKSLRPAYATWQDVILKTKQTRLAMWLSGRLLAWHAK